MRISFNSSFDNGLANLQRAAEQLARWQRQVSSGRRVEVASDDPASARAAIRDTIEIGTIDHYGHAADSVDSRLAVADTVLSDMVNQLTLARSTAAAAQTTVLTAEQRNALADQLGGVRDALFTDLNTAFAGRYLFSGSATMTAPYARNPDGTIAAYAGDSTVVSVDVERGKAIQVTFDGEAVTRGSDPANVFASLETLMADVRAGNSAGIDAGMQALSNALDRVVRTQSTVGIDQGALETIQSRLSAAKAATTTQLTKERDADMAEAISGMTQAEAAYRAALGAMGQIGRLSLFDYLR